MSTTSKQDRQGSRTPADLERKYDLGSMGDRFAEVMGIALDAQTHSAAALDAIGQTNSVVAELSQKVDEISINVKDLDEGTISNLSTRVGVISASVSAIDKNVNSAEFVIGIINKQSTAKISADRLDIIGKKLNIKVDATNIEGKVTAKQIDVLDLSAFGATIGGWDIYEGGISKTKTSDTDNTDISICEVGIFPPYDFSLGNSPKNKIFYVRKAVEVEGDPYSENYPFYVQADGFLHSEYGEVGGWSISSLGLSRSFIDSSSITNRLELNADGVASTITYTNGNYSRASLYNGVLNITESESSLGYGYVIAYYSNEQFPGSGYMVYIDPTDNLVKAEKRFG